MNEGEPHHASHRTFQVRLPVRGFCRIQVQHAASAWRRCLQHPFKLGSIVTLQQLALVLAFFVTSVVGQGLSVWTPYVFSSSRLMKFRTPKL
jgi:hypothetical protein